MFTDTAILITIDFEVLRRYITLVRKLTLKRGFIVVPESRDEPQDKKDEMKPRGKGRRFSEKFSADNDRDLPEFKAPDEDDKK